MKKPGRRAGSERQATRTWRTDTDVDPAAVDGPGSVLRRVLLVVEGIGLVVVLVLCAPTDRAGRRRDDEEVER